MKKFCCAFIFLLLVLSSSATLVQQSVYINRGVFTTVSNTTFPFLAFNETSAFDQRNVRISLQPGDSLELTVTNNDTMTHGFAITNTSINISNLGIGQSLTVIVPAMQFGNYILYDPLNYPDNRYLGLGAMICVLSNSADKNYFWNIKEHEMQYNDDLANGMAVDWTQYYPDYFTINGLSHPDLQNDTTAVVDANIGDTVHIFMSNTGTSVHSIHFHGFHVRIIYSSEGTEKLNWVKGTVSIASMETYVLELVPDKIGLYAVHDHNLVAVTGGNTHPNGMFLIMNIQ